MAKYREFKIGDKVSILLDRMEEWQNSNPMIVKNVIKSSSIRSSGHPQLLRMTNGETYSGWWFDPACPCLWAKKD